MRDQSVFGEATQQWRMDDMSVTPREREILRGLAQRVAATAADENQQRKAALWKQHNSLQRTRPLIFCDPENGWNEIVIQDELECTGELARAWENKLKKELFWAERMGDDKVTDADFNVYHAYTNTGWGVTETMHRTEDAGSYAWEAPFDDYSRMDILHFPKITVDHDKTNQLLEAAHDVFDGILNVRLKGQWWWSIGLTYTLVMIRGLERFMIDMYDEPENLHRLMAFLRDGFLQELDDLERNGLLSLNNGNTYVGSGGFGFTDELPAKGFDGRVRTQDMWGFLESQETVGVSPAMFKEFVFDYQLPILERFGLNCYGCCEPLNARWDVVKKTPRLRRVSVSPWADRRVMADLLGGGYVYSYKPNPADLAFGHLDEPRIRTDLREFMATTKDCRVEIIMKDNHTICGDPRQVTEWCRIAMEEACALD